MSKKFASVIRFAAIATVATTIGATGALASDAMPSVTTDAMMHAIHAQQASTRKAVFAMVEKSRDLGISPKRVAQLDRILATQTQNRKALFAVVEKSRDLGISPKRVAQLDRILATQTQNRKALFALVEKSRALGMSPKAVALLEGNAFASQLAKRQGVLSSDIDG